MPHQQESVKQSKSSHQGLNNDGLIELDDAALESITGGHMGTAAQARYDQEEAALIMAGIKTPVIINNDQSVNVANASSGIGSIKSNK